MSASESSVRVAKHRVEKKLKNGDLPTLNNLKILKANNEDIRPYISKSKKILDSIVKKSISTVENN
ncbi:hypothetical protein [Arcobacter arenosus]|uniref:Uncharacterized protein n=1 Tax=Arcobacter arenosus TaxID=2576037 RepID=A0A5R8Y4L0_9BACT|nr:hypothetical protein [Arcobacter arenosus]TLP41059.1 hypothetical protein FDK22_03295 [Arcobacter arenosus]